MSLLKSVPPTEATGEVAVIYEQIKAAFGGVPNVMSIWSASPYFLKQQFEMIGYYMQHPKLSGALLACIRMLVSQDTHCEYCVGMNAGMLINMMGWTPEQVAALQADPTAANLPEREKAMLLLVLKAVHDSTGVAASDLDALRVMGWDDSDIFDAVNHGARMVAGDIILNTFKVELDY
jgi:uncharacterized peroxidase-related enzyme